MKNKKLLFIFLLVIMLIPTKTNAITLKEYEDKVNAYKNEVNAKNNQINKSKQEINSINNEISSIKNTISKLTNEVKMLNEEIEAGKEEIKSKEKQTQDLLEYVQYSSGENIYLEYAFGADTVTDLIYRMSIAQQLSDYNNEVIEEIENTIEENKKREKEIEKKKKTLNSEQKSLQAKIQSINSNITSLKTGATSAQQQVEIYQKLVDSYKKMGCKSSDVIGVTCAVENTAVGWYRPTVKGAISQTVGWTAVNIDGFHYGTDIYSSRKKNEKIYPIANGTISSIYKDYYGALVVVIYHKDINGKSWTSLYCHLSKYNPSIYVGMKVTENTYIGYMGDTGYAFGVHLHIEVADCRLFDSSDKNCKTWDKWSSYIKKKYSNNKFQGAKTLLKLPNSWSSR